MLKILLLLLLFIPYIPVSADDAEEDPLGDLIEDIIRKEKDATPKAEKAEPQPKQKSEPKQKPEPKQTPAKKKSNKIIVIDPGHGGKDPGTVKGRLYEKDIVLRLAKKIRDVSKKYKGIEVRLTRDRDIFLELPERAKIANRLDGDLFISLHVNSFKDETAAGMEIYHLDNTRNEYSRKLASVENKISGDVSTLEMILIDMDLTYYIDDSISYASSMAKNINKDLAGYKIKLRDYRKGALFYVLVGARMPSLLFEIGYISNPTDRALLQNDKFLETLARALLNSIAETKLK
ncbi:N-acetylmuramoyl-L-alanine amidase [bacterium]|nr:N-acetylmuramoyl-L-alanine amidase [bacterium]